MTRTHNIPIYGVTEFNTLLRDSLESNFNYIKIRGEISELKNASKGQLYITIKDDNSILSAVVWESKVKYLITYPEVGMEVIAHGKITTWSRYKTTYQLDIDNIEVAGEGALLKLIEERKKRLAAKGMFDAKYKKKLPYLPKKIGVITSPTGSVIHDIINRLKERFPVSIDLWPTPVQGNDAIKMIISAINGFNDDSYFEKPDVLIIARGGGSVEDLMIFNDESLAIAVFNSVIPIVTAIGHETDTTIVDFVSDLRSATPTAAAETIVPVRNELIIQVNKLSDRIVKLIDNKITNLTERYYSFIRLLKDPKYILDNYKEKFNTTIKDLSSSYKILIDDKNNKLQYNYSKLKSPVALLELRKVYSHNLFKNLDIQISQKIKNCFFSFNNAAQLLYSNSLDNNLKKGFVLLKKNKKIIKRAKQLEKKDNIKIKFFDEQIDVKIQKN